MVSCEYHVSIMCFNLYPVQEHCVHCGPWMQTRPEEDCPPCEKCRIQPKSMRLLSCSTKSESSKLMPPLQVATALLVMQPVSLIPRPPQILSRSHSPQLLDKILEEAWEQGWQPVGQTQD